MEGILMWDSQILKGELLISQACLAHRTTNEALPSSSGLLCCRHQSFVLIQDTLVFMLMQKLSYYTSARILGLPETIGRDAGGKPKLGMEIM